jgi:hypothetical protein
MIENIIKEERGLDEKIREAIASKNEKEVERLKQKYFNHFEETWIDSDPKRYGETYQMKSELKNNLKKLRKGDLEVIYNDLLKDMKDERIIDVEADRIFKVYNMDIKGMISSKFMDFENIKSLKVKEVREAIKSVYSEMEEKEQRAKAKKEKQQSASRPVVKL